MLRSAVCGNRSTCSWVDSWADSHDRLGAGWSSRVGSLMLVMQFDVRWEIEGEGCFCGRSKSEDVVAVFAQAVLLSGLAG